jgi:RNA polymerase sigma factor (sigma-70 family)
MTTRVHRRLEVLTDDELIQRAQSGDRDANTLLVERHMGLVRTVAQRYRGLGLPIEDLVQEGAIGLLGAIDGFDADRGASFATYAFWRIRHAVTAALTEQGHVVRLPKQIVERRTAISKVAAQLTAANEREPSVAEIATRAGLSPAAVTEALGASTPVASLNELVAGGAVEREALIADAGAPDPEAEVVQHEQLELVKDAIGHLPNRQRLVVTHHFGLGHVPETLADVGRELHLSPQRTRALEQDALRRLADELEPASVAR